MRSPTTAEIEQLYRAIADGEPRLEPLQMIYDMFGKSYGLRPPADEMRLADRCANQRSAARG
jgi:hypothetical protein